MRYDPFRHTRRSIRPPGYDYASPGAYFITICTQAHEPLFGTVADSEVILNQYGEVVQGRWHDLPRHYRHVAIDEFVVMPNHVHGIIVLLAEAGRGDRVVGAGLKPAPTRRPLTEVVRGFKTFAARRINTLRDTPGVQVSQRNYYEHIIRDDQELTHIRNYIKDNPQRWKEDEYHP